MEREFEQLETKSGTLTPSRASNLLLGGIVLFIIVFFVWASLTKLERTVHAPGKVVPTAQLQRVSNLEGGIIDRILVREGDVVKAGEPLILLDKTALTADLGVSEVSYEALRYKVERLEAEVAGRAPRFLSPKNPQLAEQVAVERSLYQTRQSDLSSLLNAARERLVQAQRSVDEARSNQDAARFSRDAARQQLDLLRPLVDNGVEPRNSLIQAQRSYDIAQSQLAASGSALSRAQASVGEAQFGLTQARQQWRAQAANELATAQSEMAARASTMPAVEAKLNRAVIRSPLTGRVNRVLVSTVGGTVASGQPLVEIVPTDGDLVVEASVKPADIAFVYPGQSAQIKITAYDSAIYGNLEGRVENISPDAIIDERTGETRYYVRIRSNTSALVSQSGKRLPISPGMVADVNLTGDERSILDYILTPITRISDDAFREQ